MNPTPTPLFLESIQNYREIKINIYIYISNQIVRSLQWIRDLRMGEVRDLFFCNVYFQDILVGLPLYLKNATCLKTTGTHRLS